MMSETMGNKSELSRYFEPLAVQVASGSSVKAASEIVGCSIHTAYNISATADFKMRVSELRSEIASGTVGTLTTAASTAAATLLELLGPTNEPTVRLNAAKAVLASLGPMAELGELRARIDALEKLSKGST